MIIIRHFSNFSLIIVLDLLLNSDFAQFLVYETQTWLPYTPNTLNEEISLISSRYQIDLETYNVSSGISMELNEVMEMDEERGIEMLTLWDGYWMTNYERGGEKDGNRQLEDLHSTYYCRFSLHSCLTKIIVPIWVAKQKSYISVMLYMDNVLTCFVTRWHVR